MKGMEETSQINLVIPKIERSKRRARIYWNSTCVVLATAINCA